MSLPNRTPHKISKKQETALAKRLGGKRQPGSGSMWHAKGDVRAGGFLGECKITGKASFSVKHSVLRKIQKESAKKGLYPFLAVGFNGSTKPEWVMIDIGMFEALKDLFEVKI